MPTVDPRVLAAVLGAVAILALAATGYIRIMTPGEAQCAVELADAKARLELLTEAKNACKDALGACSGGHP